MYIDQGGCKITLNRNIRWTNQILKNLPKYISPIGTLRLLEPFA